jgi:hypothetical protein
MRADDTLQRAPEWPNHLVPDLLGLGSHQPTAQTAELLHLCGQGRHGDHLTGMGREDRERENGPAAAPLSRLAARAARRPAPAPPTTDRFRAAARATSPANRPGDSPLCSPSSPPRSGTVAAAGPERAVAGNSTPPLVSQDPSCATRPGSHPAFRPQSKGTSNTPNTGLRVVI